MKPPRLTRRRLILLLVAIPLVPACLWTVLLAVVPTDWARRRLVRELETVTGRKVEIGSIRLGPLGNLRIRDVFVSETDHPDDPWLKVGEARLDLHLVRMVMGCCKTTAIAVDGLDLRIHRRPDGSLEFADLLCARPDPRDPSDDSASGARRGPVTLTLRGATIRIIDDPTDTRVELEDADGEASWSDGTATIRSIKGRLNGGTFEMAANYDRVGSAPTFEAELRATGVALNTGLKSIGLLVPIASEESAAFAGRLDLQLALSGSANSLASLKSNVRGHGAIRLKPIDLSHSKLLDSLEVLQQIPTANRVGSVESDFVIENGRVLTDDLTLKVSSLPIILAGWTDFDGRIDYRLRADAIRERITGKLPPEAHAILGEITQELGDLSDVRIGGTLDDPKVTVGKRSADGRRPPRAETEARLRDAARKLGAKYLR